MQFQEIFPALLFLCCRTEHPLLLPFVGDEQPSFAWPCTEFRTYLCVVFMFSSLVSSGTILKFIQTPIGGNWRTQLFLQSPFSSLQAKGQRCTWDPNIHVLSFCEHYIEDPILNISQTAIDFKKSFLSHSLHVVGKTGKEKINCGNSEVGNKYADCEEQKGNWCGMSHQGNRR